MYANNKSISLAVQKSQVPSGMQMPKECMNEIHAGCNGIRADREQRHLTATTYVAEQPGASDGISHRANRYLATVAVQDTTQARHALEGAKGCPCTGSVCVSGRHA